MVDLSNFKNIKSTGGGDILKPEEGKSYKIRMIGEPWVYTSEYQGKSSVRFALAIYNQTDGGAQVLMLSRTAFADIFALSENEDWGDPEDYDITMKRTGIELETKYSFAPSPKKELEKAKRDEVEAIELHEILDRLPSIQTAFPLSKVNDMDELLPKKTPVKATEVFDEAPDPEMPPDFLN